MTPRVLLLLLLLPATLHARPPRARNTATAPLPTGDKSANALAARIAGAELTSGQAYAILQSLTDHVGARFAGTPGAERAIDWALAKMRELGLQNVHREPVEVPRWVRGVERASIIGPVEQPLRITTLGGSVATPAEGLRAELVEVDSIDALKSLGERARGRIVLFNKAMERSRGFEGYSAVVPLRSRGALEAARLGAVAALVRSTGTGLFRLPHTGAMRYDPSGPKIPAAALAAEDAELLHRLLQGGKPVTLDLRITAHMEGTVTSANVVGELPGRVRPQEIVLIGAHLDSWDLATGALDDGAGCAVVLETARLLSTLGLTPERTVRVVLFMNEEFGLDGARAYAQAHAAELTQHVAALESDSGAGKPLGVVVTGTSDAVALVEQLIRPWSHSSVLHLDVRGVEQTGADIGLLLAKGVPGLGVMQDVSSYFDWHHTAADTLDKVDPLDLSLVALSFAALTHSIADSSMRLPPPPAAH